MAINRAALLLCVVLSAAVGTQALFGSSKAISTPVIMFDDDDISGDSQNFPVVLPTVPAGGCAPCENLVRSQARRRDLSRYLFRASMCARDYSMMLPGLQQYCEVARRTYKPFGLRAHLSQAA